MLLALNLCVPCPHAEAMHCRTQSFDLAHTCLVRELDDKPRWLVPEVHAARYSGVVRNTLK